MDKQLQQSDELRKRAEAVLLDETPANITNLSPEEIQKTIYNLRVHQLELEIQNEELRRTQAELDVSWQRYFDFYNLAPVGFCTISAQGLILETNLTAASLLGLTPSELINQPVTNFIHKEDQDLYYLSSRSQFKTKDPQEYDLRMVRGDESVFWALFRTIATQDPAGAPVCRLVLTDITLRKQHEHFIRKLIDVLPGMVGYWDQNLRCVFANQGYQKWFGKSPEQMQGIHIRDLMGDELFSRNEPFITAAMRGADQHFARTLIKADGSTGYTWANYIPDSDGARVDGFFVLVADITALKQAEADLKAQDEFYKATLDGIGAHICVIDLQGVIITTNRAWEVFFGAEGHALQGCRTVGSNFFSTCPSPSTGQDHAANEFVTGIRAVLNGTSPLFIKEYSYHTPEKDLWFLCKASPFSVNGVRYAVLSDENITERKQAEAILHRKQAMLARTEKITQVGSWEWDVATDTVTWSDELFRLFQLEPAERAPSYYTEHAKLYHPEDMELLRSAVAAAVDKGTPYEIELRALRQDGTMWECLARGQVEEAQGDSAKRLVGSLQDITVRKQILGKRLKNRICC